MFTIIIIERLRFGGETRTVTRDTEIAALAFCREEVKWESTQRVHCAALDFDREGDFA